MHPCSRHKYPPSLRPKVYFEGSSGTALDCVAVPEICFEICCNAIPSSIALAMNGTPLQSTQLPYPHVDLPPNLNKVKGLMNDPRVVQTSLGGSWRKVSPAERLRERASTGAVGHTGETNLKLPGDLRQCQ